MEELKIGTNGHSTNGFADRSIDFFYLLGILWRFKYFIFGVTFVTGVLSIIYVLNATPYYQSTVTLYPVNKDHGGPLKQLAVSLGISNKTSGYYIIDVLRSRRITSEVIYNKYYSVFFPDSVDLIHFLELDGIDVSDSRKYQIASRSLGGAVTIREDKETSLITLSVVTRDKFVSKAIAEKYCEATIRYLNEEERSSISQTIAFTEERLEIVKSQMIKAQNEFIAFQEANISTRSPSLSMQTRQMMKDIELIQSLVVLLEKQLELLRIEEEKEKPVINILDYPVVVDRSVRPRKREVVMINTILSFFISYVVLILHEKAKKYGIYQRIFKELKS